jgi:hypothetical protein
MHVWPGETLNIKTWKAKDSQQEKSNVLIVEATVDRANESESKTVSISDSKRIEQVINEIKGWYDGERGMTKYDASVT